MCDTGDSIRHDAGFQQIQYRERGTTMRFSYQVATPDLKHSNNVTCMQGDFEESIRRLASFGYNAVEIMTTYPKSIDWERIKRS